tara:strand:+ start:100 stop:360 length:261 start_codon:yes stop_codon:yes gene_type:complete
MKHQIVVKMQVEGLVEVDLSESPDSLLSKPNRSTARKLVRKLVDEGRIAADVTCNEHYSLEDDPIIPDWAEVSVVGNQYINSHIEQ